jgi:hypothetical protein
MTREEQIKAVEKIINVSSEEMMCPHNKPEGDCYCGKNNARKRIATAIVDAIQIDETKISIIYEYEDIWQGSSVDLYKLRKILAERKDIIKIEVKE